MPRPRPKTAKKNAVPETTPADKSAAQSGHSDQWQPSGGGIPRERWPLLALFLTITIGSFFVWSWFARQPLLDEYTYEIVATYPHDPTSFTQGLVYRDGILYESTGKFNESKIRKVDLKTGKPLRSIDLDGNLFGEGLTAIDDQLIQVTWQNRVGIVYDMELNEIRRFELHDDAWGLTWDGKQLILSDGTSTIRFLDPETFEVQREVMVRLGDRRLGEINELEYINGLIYANVWKQDDIYQIRPVDGKVIGRINLRDLYPRSQRKDPMEAVLNGIAINPASGNLIVTGKYWPEVFEIKLLPVQ